MDKMIGMRLKNRYEIQELIGVGGMANVYKAFDIMEQRVVAVKILREEFLSNEDFVRRFKNESKAIGELSHPNIVKVYDVITDEPIQSIVMEYVDGITLKEYIEYKKVLPWKEAVHFTIQILRALQHAHDHGIVHRDIKPQNIMLLSDRTIKVMDFGIARFSRSESQTMTDKAIGSVHYISPEQARGDVIDDKADIYSVGVMLFEMLTGKLPFEADSPVSVAIKQIQSIPTRPREINKDIPVGIEEITLRAMQKDAAQRYQSAAEMLKDLEVFKHNPEIRFDYKYFVDENPTRPIDVPGDKPGAKKGGGKPQTEDEEKSPIVPILTAVALAFVSVAVLFVIGMLIVNNPFVSVAEFDAPTLVGLKLEDVQNNPEYMNKFKIVQEKTDYSEEYEAGVIYEQDPKPGRKMKEGGTIEVSVSIGKQSHTMPTLHDSTLDDAKAALSSLGITPTIAKVYDSAVQEGNVVSTSPEPGAEITSSTPVTLYISMGAEDKLISVPDLTGIFKEGDIRKVLSNHGLQLGTITEQEGTMPNGTVLSQSPAAGSQVTAGSTVNVVVSKKNTGKSYQVDISLPSNITTTITVQAYLDGSLVTQELVNPSQTPIWSPTFTGKDTGTIIINIDNVLYKQLELDFNTGKYKVTKDNSSAFVEPPPESDPDEDDAGSAA